VAGPVALNYQNLIVNPSERPTHGRVEGKAAIYVIDTQVAIANKLGNIAA